MVLIKPRGKPVSHHILFMLITYSCTVTGRIHRNKPLADDSISPDQQHFGLFSILLHGSVSCYDYIATTPDERNMSMEHWWNDTNRGKLKYLKKNLCWCHCPLWSQTPCPVTKPQLLLCDVSDQPTEPWHNMSMKNYEAYYLLVLGTKVQSYGV
jgi:hypothetical protein